MSKEIFEFAEPFFNADGISGFEDLGIAKVYADSAKASGATITRGGLGSVIAKRGDKGPKLMFAAHMDEVGFVVRDILENGYLMVSPIGGIWTHTMLAMKVKVINKEGKEFNGVVGSTTVHVLEPAKRKKVVDIKDGYVDLGFNTNKEVIAAGIQIGDPIVRISKSEMIGNGDKFMAKALDNRYSVAILAKVLDELKDVELNCQLFAVATSQEEVGCRGAKASSQAIKPDVAITLDTTTSHDTPQIIKGDTKLGKGAALTVKDAFYIANPRLTDALWETAKENNIDAYKTVSLGGGNDSSEMQYAGVGTPVITIAPPIRYMHTPFEIGSFHDFKSIVALTVAFIKKFDQEMADHIKY